ncbi:MAG: serine:threonine protein kinase [Solirubrobacterales bacterium]|nr:serine:threonine protein kinase [Solirubrobacterales bacterium]
MIGEGSLLKDRYRLERLLGRGGMASVWLAGDEVLERSVAVKVLADTIASDPEFLARFRREARVAASLSHPNLIGVYDYAEGDERPYLVMEYVPGQNLAERMAAKAPIDCERLARELLGALAHIHAAGIVHRDIKPGNVLIAPDGSAKLIDFGIALPRNATALTLTGHLLGTARYIAPEVMAGGAATERSDLYSCGIMLRDCTGDRPQGRLPALLARLSSGDPRGRPASAKEALIQLNRRMPTQAQPTERFSPTFGRPRAQPSPEAPTQRLQPGARRSARGRVAAAAGILAGLAVAFFLITGGSTNAPQRNGKIGPSVASNDREAGATSPTETEAGAASPAETEAATTVPTPAGNDLALASSLNQQGFELAQSGAYEEAVPVLEEAVRAFPAGTEDLDYAYALFNLGNALRLSGRPEAAIPVLERRLEIPNQTGTVSRELAAARREAGL